MRKHKLECCLLSIILSVFCVLASFAAEATDKNSNVLVPSFYGKKYDYSSIKVKKVLAYDLLLLENGEEVHLIGIHCPLFDRNIAIKDGKVVCSKQTKREESLKFVKDMVEGKRVSLEFDSLKKAARNRLWAYAFVSVFLSKRIEDLTEDEKFTFYPIGEEGHYSMFLNAELLRLGLVDAHVEEPNDKYLRLFKNLDKSKK